MGVRNGERGISDEEKVEDAMTKLKVLLIIVLTVSGCATVQENAFIDYYDKGVAYSEKGEYDAAIEQFKMTIKAERPNAPDYYVWTRWSYWRLALSYQAKGQYKDAVSYYQKEIARGDGDTHTFRRLAQCYNGLNQYDDAIVAGRRAIELDFTNECAHFELAWAFYKTKQYKNANKAYKKAIELDPKVPGYYNRWGDLLMDSGDYAGAAEQYKKAVSLWPNKVLFLSNFADNRRNNLKRDREDYAWPAEQYKKAVSLRPNKVLFLSKLADVYYSQGKYDDALDAANKGINLSTFAGIGVEFQIVENYPVVISLLDPCPAKKAGIKAGDKIIKIDGKRIKEWKLNDVISAIRDKEGTKVVFLIKRKDTKNPLEIAVIRENIIQKEASSIFSGRSLVLRHVGKKQESLKDAKQGYSLNSSDQWAQFALGAAYLDQGRYDEAVKLLSQVRESTSARILEATAYAKKGDFKKAINSYSVIPEEKLSPKNVSLWSDRTALLESLTPFISSKIETAGRLKTQGKYKEALIELGDALKVADDKTSEEMCGAIYRIMSLDPRLSVLPEEAREYALRGDVLTEEGKFKDAVTEYRQAVQKAPYIAKLYFNTAMIYGELKRYPQAIRHMKTYLNLAPEAPNARAAQDQIYKWKFKMEKEK